jgi:hypothetical protein
MAGEPVTANVEDVCTSRVLASGGFGERSNFNREHSLSP